MCVSVHTLYITYLPGGEALSSFGSSRFKAKEASVSSRQIFTGQAGTSQVVGSWEKKSQYPRRGSLCLRYTPTYGWALFLEGTVVGLSLRENQRDTTIF